MCLLTLKEQILLHKKKVSFDKIKKGSESKSLPFFIWGLQAYTFHFSGKGGSKRMRRNICCCLLRI